MSPTAFKQQVSHLLSAITSSLDLCNTIRQNRKLGPTTVALDTLQTTLSSDLANIQATYTTLRKHLGSRMDLGDEPARMSINTCIRNVQENIESRLDDLAYKRKEKDGKEKRPGFGDMTRRWQDIEHEVLATLEGLGERIENERIVEIPPPSQPKRPEQQQQQQEHYYVQHQGADRDHERPQQPKHQHNSDEVVISLKQFDHFVQHMKNCWVEKNVSGKIIYINAFDDKFTQWERPSAEKAFIRSLPAQPQKAKASKGRKAQVEDEEDESEVESRRRKEKRDRERAEKEKEKAKRDREEREKIDRERERERELREFLERERRERELVERELRERELREKELREEEYRERLRRQQLHQQQQQQQANTQQQQGRRPGPPGGWEHGRGW